MKAIIIDDEKKSAFSLAHSLQCCSVEVDVFKMFHDPAIAIQELNGASFDVLFLDISMPKMNGFELLEKLDNIDFHVVFVTAFDNYAIKAFQVGALDYLLKPIDEQLLEKTLQRLTGQEVEKKETYLAGKINYDQLREPKISVGVADGLEIISVKDIVRCEADGSYTTIYCLDNSLVVTKTLKQMEDKLEPYPFFRTHNSHLVNLNYIKKYHKGTGGSVEMMNGDQVIVSRYKKKALLEELGRFF